MHILNRQVLVGFWKKHRDAQSALQAWIDTVEKARWQSIVDVKQVYPSADAVGSCTVFNIKGNNYRLITKIHYKTQIVAIAGIYTHPEYDRGGWKNGCKV